MSDQPIDISEKVTSYTESGSSVDAIYLDFAKALDKVPHHRLASKLLSHAIREKVYDWIVEWLKGRHQRVCLGGTLSDWLTMLNTVLQGSVFRPILFLIFINDLDFSIKSQFADDTKLFRNITNTYDYNELQEDLNNLMKWSEEWQMLFNMDKCKVMHLGRSNDSHSYYMNDSDNMSEETDLGIWISKDSKVSQQCVHAYSKANKLLRVLNRTKYKDVDNLVYLLTTTSSVLYCGLLSSLCQRQVIN